MASIVRKDDLVQALGGGQGGVCALLLALPIESVQKMQCTAGGKPPGVLECCHTIFRMGGIGGFWRGLPPLVLQAFVEKFCYFLPYSALVFYFEQRFGTMGYLANLVIGYIAELVRIPFNYPIEVVATYTQTNPEVRGTRDAISIIYKTQGGVFAFCKSGQIKGRGMSGYIMVAARPAIGQAVFDQVKRAYLLRTGRPITALLSFGEALACGAIGRFAATLVCYPCYKLKVLAQSGKGSLMDVWKTEGAAGVYKGFWSEMARGIVFNATMMAVKESIETVNAQLLGIKYTQ